jgi:hypothetical protein
MPPTYRLVEAGITVQFEAARSLIEEYAAQIGSLMGVATISGMAGVSYMELNLGK